MSNKIRNRALAILLISFIGCWFTGVVLVNAESEESITLNERVARIEGTLAQMNERLLELNHLGDRIDALHTNINNANRTLTIVIFSAIILTPFAQSLAKRYIDRH